MVYYDENQIQSLCKKIAECTDRNNHTGALIVLAGFLECKKIIKALQALQVLIDYNGFLSSDLKDIRLMLSIDTFFFLENTAFITDEDKKRIKSLCGETA